MADDKIEAQVAYVPESFMVMQTVPAVPSVAANLGLDAQLPPNAIVTNELKAGLYLRGDGALDGVAPVSNGNTIPVIRNWQGDMVRTDLINNLLLDPGQQENQFVAVEQTVVQNGYPGVVIDYRGVDAIPSARADFVHLITGLAERLHAANKTLGVRVEPPQQVSADNWNTGGYDWRALSKVVDTLIVPAPVDPRAYQANGEMEALMNFATDEAERRKIQIELPAQSVEQAGNYLLLKGYQESLQPLLGEIEVAEDGSGENISVTLDNPRLLSRVVWDDTAGMYRYSYLDDQGFERVVYVEDAGSISHKLNLLQRYNLRNLSIQVPASGDVDPNVWNVLLQFQQGSELATSAGQMAVAYTMVDSAGNVVAQQMYPLDSPTMIVPAPASVGDLRVDVQLVGSNGQAVGAPQSTVLAVATAPKAENAASADAAADAPNPTVSSGQLVNVREGPNTAYPVLGQVAPGNTYTVLGKNEAGDWWQIEFDGGKGWVIGQLVNTAGQSNLVAVATDYPEPPVFVAAAAPAPAPAAAAEPAAQAAEEAPAPEPAAAPPVVSAPPPAGGIPFGYGVQAHMVHNDQAGQVMASTQGMGFNWVKQQIEWRVFEGSPGNIDFGSSDGIVNTANGAGINLLFSVVNAPAWAREPGFDGSVGGPPQDPQTFANFNGALAGKYCGTSLKAIEVWNEQNLHYEWGNKPLDAAEYVRLLAPSYQAIKAACPSMWVVSGALTPAGSNPPYAIDDFQYLEAMFQNGVANYADAIGAHPSGYNVPPSATWETACEAIQLNGNSFNGACDSPHHSWSFRSTMEGYKNIANVYGAPNVQIWPTEFGWAAGGAFDPRYAYANDNSFEEQAQWTVEAFQMAKAWGWSAPPILWNLNFRVVANGTEKAQWGIVDPGWGPLPVYNALANMPK
ncbi:MAG: SH3 domain-containing protein [Caldilineaceae bacterium]|nr:SH3 domain-containing protein [Caldilineaceae bacterium]